MDTSSTPSQVILDALAAGDATPYVLEGAAVRGKQFPDKFSLGNYKGLLACYILRRRPSGDVVVSMWKSRDAADQGFEALCLELDLQPAGDAAFVGPVVQARKSLWRRLQLKLSLPWAITALSTVVAVSSCLDKFIKGYAELFHPPRFQLASVTPRNVLVGATVPLELRYRNIGDVEAEVTFALPNVQPGGAAALARDEEYPLKIAVGQIGVAKYNLKPMQPGEIQLVFKPRGEGPWGRDAKVVDDPVTVEVWRRLEARLIKLEPAGNRCAARFEVRTGAVLPRGFEWTLRVNKLPGVVVDEQNGLRLSDPPDRLLLKVTKSLSGDLAVAKAKSEYRCEAFTRRELVFWFVAAKPLTPDEWSRLLSPLKPDLAAL